MYGAEPAGFGANGSAPAEVAFQRRTMSRIGEHRRVRTCADALSTTSADGFRHEQRARVGGAGDGAGRAGGGAGGLLALSAVEVAVASPEHVQDHPDERSSSSMGAGVSQGAGALAREASGAGDGIDGEPFHPGIIGKRGRRSPGKARKGLTAGPFRSLVDEGG